MLTTVHGLRPAAAGISLTVTGLFWAAGSQMHGLRRRAATRRAGTPAADRVRPDRDRRVRSGTAEPASCSPSGPGWPSGPSPGWGWACPRRPCRPRCWRCRPTTVQGRNTAAGNVTGSVTQSVALGGGRSPDRVADAIAAGLAVRRRHGERRPHRPRGGRAGRAGRGERLSRRGARRARPRARCRCGGASPRGSIRADGLVDPLAGLAEAVAEGDDGQHPTPGRHERAVIAASRARMQDVCRGHVARRPRGR